MSASGDPRDISTAQNPDMRAALGALERAARMARETAIQTGTAIVVFRDGKVVRITAEELRAQARAEDASVP